MQKKNHTIILVLSTWLLLTTGNDVISFPSKKEITCAGLAIAATYGCYHLLSTPEKVIPTLEMIHPVSGILLNNTSEQTLAEDFFVTTTHGTFLLQPGIAAYTTTHNEPLWVLASGWKPLFDQLFNSRVESAFTGLRRYLKRNIFHGPCITFVYKDNRRAFNFGQELDQKAFDTLYQSLTGRDLVLYGICRGTTTIINWLKYFRHEHNIKAIILESPALSLKDICEGIGRHYTNITIQGWLLNKFFGIYFPHYDKEAVSLLDNLTTLNINDSVPIFIGHINGDQITTDEKVSLLVQKLRTVLKNPIYFFRTDERLEHGTLSRSIDYQRTLNAFLKKYKLPHNPQLAEEGKDLLNLSSIFCL